MTEVVVTNSIQLPEKQIGKIKVLSVTLVGEAIRRIYEELSVSKLFDCTGVSLVTVRRSGNWLFIQISDILQFMASDQAESSNCKGVRLWLISR